jgi:4-amino-4-deoxy-L-arabinose transferase-like glycosyltransferase
VSADSAVGPPAQRTYAGIAAMIAVLWLAVLPLRPLFNPDEGRYAEIPREMLATHDWVVPHLNGLAYLEKPPLQYWATAAALRVFGNNEFGARLYTALCALATLAVVWLTANRLWGRAEAWRAGAVQGGMLLFVVLGQLLTLDMSLTFFMTLSLAAFLRAQRAPWPGHAAARPWMLLAWAAAALGVLTKGPVAAALPAAVLVSYTLAARDASPWRRLHAGWGLPLFLALTVPWYWLVARRLPGFLEFFFVHEHVSRYLTPSADREEAWWYFAAVFTLGSLPWTLSALRIVATGWRRRTPRGVFDAGLFLWIWIVFIIGFFSLSDSKLIPYILPVMPALALCVGALPDGAFGRDVRTACVLTLAAAAALAAAALFGPHWLAPTERNQYFLMLAQPLGWIAALAAVAGSFGLLAGRKDVTRATVILGAGWCLSGLLLMQAAGFAAPLYSGAVLARAVTAIPPGEPIYSVGTYDQTLPFYWRRTVRLAVYRGELDYGLKADPAAEIPSLAGFVAEWRGRTDGYAVMERSMFDELQSGAVPMREVARDARRVLVARR